ncbi:MAG: hypothetical protein FJX54_16600 [Alphaproteobacteria bacterium]|nr:hypothetical protein [Alphaproteobacteria bacterium]
MLARFDDGSERAEMHVDELVGALIEDEPAWSPGLRDGLQRYLAIQKMLDDPTIDVARNDDFQRVFGVFYRVRRDASWRRKFFELMQRYRQDPPSFEAVLHELAGGLTRCEPSFSSKLAASLNPDLPVYDSRVVAIMRFAQMPDPRNWSYPTGTLSERVHRAEELYRSLNRAIETIRASRHFRALTSAFDERHNSGRLLTDTKKLDLVLWQARVAAR